LPTRRQTSNFFVNEHMTRQNSWWIEIVCFWDADVSESHNKNTSILKSSNTLNFNWWEWPLKNQIVVYILANILLQGELGNLTNLIHKCRKIAKMVTHRKPGDEYTSLANNVWPKSFINMQEWILQWLKSFKRHTNKTNRNEDIKKMRSKAMLRQIFKKLSQRSHDKASPRKWYSDVNFNSIDCSTKVSGWWGPNTAASKPEWKVNPKKTAEIWKTQQFFQF
jgi:hypothetical protein